ncbi:MAG: rhodanese-like domain-containing protein, partial [Bradyrhizobium sp.]|uniref:rhodanese-like domain-containing protein n=1 Tax=Bradyrhizobium sp. TaxID=376 RepID=UPI003C79AF5A
MTPSPISGQTTPEADKHRLTSPAELRRRWRADEEVALLDVREEDPYSLAHPFFAVSLPLSQIELRILDLVPRRDAPIVVYDDGEGYAARALPRIAALGYSDVSMLDGGLRGYAQAGEVFRDVNVPSKAFGELVEAIRHTPSLSSDEAKALIESEKNLVVLDARRFEEYRTMSIPRGVSVPGGELAFRAREIAPSADTTIIVNCAGRTRSIIGTQSLINAGVPNKVRALRNGTIGWTLARHTLAHGADRRGAIGAFEGGPANARDVAYHAGVRHIGANEMAALVAETDRTLYRFDVRDAEEYAAGHLPGFRHYPGGQLVQETDMAAPIRGARILLTDDKGVRADMTASWLAQMGWEVYVLEGGYAGALE